MSEIRKSVLWAIAIALLSGTFSAVTLDPFMQVIEDSGLDDLAGLLGSFALTAGLSFGLCGAAFTLWRKKVGIGAGAVFVVASMIGMASAVYVAILGYDNATGSFLLPYTLGSPVGALILAVPFAFLGKFATPWRTIALATALPMLWAVGVGAFLNGDAALNASGLATLYIGWQALFLGVFAAARRA
ncbi:hypothetical protein KUL25_20235 [Rhodobacteraceae bacterium N5(2021)]|uniref:Uncharacterized protein n=1 Tax=Gymnodinialimonas phycosphaerae TaxID=2841589 RepID=A0A975TUV9_9RHOB|nr:hypothetical protein [Gymnodinialimonas phycosphaerae]MBY4895096.1 hypothetical protein [Gymnodinialimonas phycosphaerae]